MDDHGYDEAFYARQDDSSSRAAAILVPLLMGLVPADSVLDAGCGTGAFLKEFACAGAGRIQGIDGTWVDPALLQIPTASFRHVDFDGAIPEDIGTFDLAISLEVAEHLPPQHAAGFVDLLCGAADTVVFGAAIPGQGGDHHVNEQWPDYWAEKFATRGYRCFDCLRPRLWSMADMPFWYAQNTCIYSRADIDLGPAVEHPLALVHPRLFQKATRPRSTRDLSKQVVRQVRDRFRS